MIQIDTVEEFIDKVGYIVEYSEEEEIFYCIGAELEGAQIVSLTEDRYKASSNYSYALGGKFIEYVEKHEIIFLLPIVEETFLMATAVMVRGESFNSDFEDAAHKELFRKTEEVLNECDIIVL